jgi:hypothetical protein
MMTSMPDISGRTTACRPTRDPLLGAIREDFAEMPGMRLTRAQFRRLWNLTDTESDQLVCHLIASGFLCEDPYGRIGRRAER